MRPLSQIARNVLPEIGELQRRASGVGKPLALGVAIAAQIQHQPADGIGRIAAILEHVVPGFVALHGLVLAKGREQIAKRLDGNVEGSHGRRERDENGMRGSSRVAQIQLPLPPVQQFERAGRARQLRRPDRRPSGNRHKRCKNAGASGAAAARKPRENFRSGAWPASACSARLRPACSRRAATSARFRVRKVAA